jgi:hypothetical protein
MRRILLLLITIILFSSCKKNPTNDFDYIEYSSFDNGNILYSIKIFPDGKINIYSYNFFRPQKKYYSVTIDKKEMDSIVSLSKQILDTKIDSVNKFDCIQCLSFCLIIKTKNRKFETKYLGEKFSNKNLPQLHRFAIQMDNLLNKQIRTIDSTFVFESISEYLLPPPPPGQSNVDIINKILPNQK